MSSVAEEPRIGERPGRLSENWRVNCELAKYGGWFFGWRVKPGRRTCSSRSAPATAERGHSVRYVLAAKLVNESA